MPYRRQFETVETKTVIPDKVSRLGQRSHEIFADAMEFHFKSNLRSTLDRTYLSPATRFKLSLLLEAPIRRRTGANDKSTNYYL